MVGGSAPLGEVHNQAAPTLETLMQTRPLSAVAAASFLLSWSGTAQAACVYAGSPGPFMTCINTELQALQATVDAQQLTIDAQQVTIDAQEATLAGHDLLITDAQAGLDALSVEHTALDGRVAVIEVDYLTAGDLGDLPELATYLTVDTTTHHVIVDGANLQVRSGSGETAGDINGLGNLIIGYDETGDGGDKTGSHNLVVGRGHGYTRFGGIVAGVGNTISGDYANVLGGIRNNASGTFSAIVAGDTNSTTQPASAILAGAANTASGVRSAIVGGAFSDTLATDTAILGGNNGTAVGGGATIVGGENTRAEGDLSVVLGGSGTVATDDLSVVP